MGSSTTPRLVGLNCIRKQASENYEKRASKQYLSVVSASFPASRFLEFLPQLLSVMECDLRTVCQNKLFPSQVAFLMVFCYKNRSPK